MKKIFFWMLILFVCGGQVQGFAFDENDEKTAIAAAQTWLKDVDADNYPGSWQGAAEYFQSVVKQDHWVQNMGLARQSLGKIIGREIDSAQFYTTLPGAPDGEYLVIIFYSSYENNARVIETVTSMKVQDNVWKVAGYYIR